MGAKARRIAPVAHIADKERAVGKAELQFCFKMPEVHHTGAQVIADENDAGVFLKMDQGRRRLAALDQH